MAAISEKDKRTLRLAAIGISIYRALFFGVRGWKRLESRRSDYQLLLGRVQREEQEARSYENKVLLFQKYRDAWRLEPGKLSPETLVAEASTAIQNAAWQDGITLGPVRESPGMKVSCRQPTGLSRSSTATASSWFWSESMAAKAAV